MRKHQPQRRKMKLHKQAIYALLALLFISGVLWLAIHAIATDVPLEMMAYQAVKLGAMRVHALAGVMTLLALGGVWATHSRMGWRLQINRLSGVIQLVSWMTLALTAYFLGYAPEGALRLASQWLHWGLGLALPLLVLWHVLVAKYLMEHDAVLQAGNTPVDK
jgi:hypothetical protein